MLAELTDEAYWRKQQRWMCKEEAAGWERICFSQNSQMILTGKWECDKGLESEMGCKHRLGVPPRRLFITQTGRLRCEGSSLKQLNKLRGDMSTVRVEAPARHKSLLRAPLAPWRPSHSSEKTSSKFSQVPESLCVAAFLEMHTQQGLPSVWGKLPPHKSKIYK